MIQPRRYPVLSTIWITITSIISTLIWWQSSLMFHGGYFTGNSKNSPATPRFNIFFSNDYRLPNIFYAAPTCLFQQLRNAADSVTQTIWANSFSVTIIHRPYCFVKTIQKNPSLTQAGRKKSTQVFQQCAFWAVYNCGNQSFLSCRDCFLSSSFKDSIHFFHKCIPSGIFFRRKISRTLSIGLKPQRSNTPQR